MIVRNKNLIKNGFTLIELIVVIAILVILAAVAVPRVSSYIERSQLAADRATLKTLNTTTTIYAISKNINNQDIFKGYNTDEDRIQQIVNEEFLTKAPVPQLKNAQFKWIIENQMWVLQQGSTIIPITPLGNTFTEISTSMIDLIKQKYLNTGSYGRSWGDYRYTDLGLKESDWTDPFDHAIYMPTGNLLRIAPEEGYRFFIDDLNKEVPDPRNKAWHLIYNTENDKWYFHSVAEANIVNINTLVIKRAN